MRTATIFTVGFDPKFPFKTILEQPNSDLFVAIIGSDKNEKVTSALDEISKFVKEYVGKEMEIWEIDFSTPHRAFFDISQKLARLNNYRIVLDVSGGMRIIGIVSMAAAIVSVDPWRLEIKIWTEDLKGRYDLSFLTYISLRPSFSSLSIAVLKAVAESGGSTLEDLSSKLKKSKPTVFRSVKLLKDLGLISSERRGRRDFYTPTIKGLIISQVAGVVYERREAGKIERR